MCDVLMIYQIDSEVLWQGRIHQKWCRSAHAPACATVPYNNTGHAIHSGALNV